MYKYMYMRMESDGEDGRVWKFNPEGKFNATRIFFYFHPFCIT